MKGDACIDTAAALATQANQVTTYAQTPVATELAKTLAQLTAGDPAIPLALPFLQQALQHQCHHRNLIFHNRTHQHHQHTYPHPEILL